MRLGLGLGLRPLRVPPVVTVSPSTLFGAGQVGGWWDPSDSATVFQDTAGTTPAAVGDPVGRINDKSGNGNHLIQATAGLRPIRRAAGALSYLEYDNSDDTLAVTLTGLTTTMDVMFSGQRLTGMAAVPVYATSLSQFILATATGDGQAANTSAGTPSLFVNGVAVPGGTASTRAQLATAWTVSTDMVLETVGADLSGWASFAVGTYAPAFAGLRRVYAMVARQALTTQQRNDLRTHIGSKAGLTL